jgi:predicted secreted Zn-dependent protease
MRRKSFLQQVCLDQLKYSSATADAFPQDYDFFAIKGQTQQDFGSNLEQFYKKSKLVFKKHYPYFGNFDDLWLCKEYLQDKPKYIACCK